MTTAEWIAQQKRKAGVPTGLTGNAAATVSSLNASRAQQQALVDEAAARARSQAIAQADAAARATAMPASSTPTQPVVSNTTPPQPTQAASGMNLSGINYGNVDKRSIDAGFRTANDADRQMWARIAEAYNSGDQAQVNFLLNTMQGQGNFSGYYGDDGLYYGYVRGNNGAANGSFQPVLGGKLISTGELDTNQWLTPNGQVWSGSLGGALSNTGGTWSYGSTTPASTTRTGSGTAMGTAGTAAGGGTGTAYGTANPARTTPSAVTTTPAINGGTMPASYGGTGGAAPTPAKPDTTVYQAALDALGAAPEWTGGTYDPEADNLWQKYLAEYDGKQAPEYEGSEYIALRDAAMRQASEPFAYDYTQDPVWQQYRKEYTREGRRASEDTMGQYAAMTGGRPSTAAMTAAQQAGNYYSAQMADKLPELYQQAYQRYLQAYQQQLGIAGAYDSYAQQDYNQYLNQLNQWNTDRNFAYGAARDNQNLGRATNETAYQRYLDRLNQWNADRSYAYQRERDAVSDQRYDQEWAQTLREYADAQGWKAKEWEQYLKEYGDQLSEQERKWAYQMARDAVDDERYAQNLEYQKSRDAVSDAQYAQKWDYQTARDAIEDERYAQKWDYGVEQDALDRKRQSMLDEADIANAAKKLGMTEAEFYASYGDMSKLRELGVQPNAENIYQWALAQSGGNAASGVSGSGGSGGSGSSSTSSAAGPLDILEALAAAGITDQTMAQRYIEQYFPKYKGAADLAADYVKMAGLGSNISYENLFKYMQNAGIAGKSSAIAWLHDHEGFDVDTANAIADLYIGMLSETKGSGQGGDYTQDEYNWAVGIIDNAAAGKIDTSSPSYIRARNILSGNKGWEFTESIDDDVPNSKYRHNNGMPKSEAYTDVQNIATSMYKALASNPLSGDKEAAIKNLQTILSNAVAQGRIHEYEIDYILDSLGL